MKFEATSINTQLEILKRKLGGELTSPITIADAAFTNGVCKAGNPIAVDGTVANDATAIGILWNDVTDDNPNGAIIRAFACVNEDNCNANADITLATAAKDALPLIVFD